MAKVKKATVEKPTAPDHLTMNLFAPGMSALHRAGLGGLACTLKAIERRLKNGRIAKKDLPAPFDGDSPPWEIDEQSVTLRFGKPENAGEYLKKLFAFAFQIRNGLIYLPGQYGDVPPSDIILAAIQDGIQNTFLQHGPTCGSRDGERTITVEVNEIAMSVTHDAFTSYKHQGWFWLDRDEKSKEKDPITGKRLKTGRRIQNQQALSVVAEDGTLSGKHHKIDNKIFPGGIVRHDRFDESAIHVSDASLICLHFSLIGCLALSINRVTAVLLIPDVHNLVDFSDYRQLLTPRVPQECHIAGAVDAALQAQIRLRSRHATVTSEVPACYAITCRPTQWNTKQKPRIATVNVPIGIDIVLDRFERALKWLSPRYVVSKTDEVKVKRKTKTKKQEPFWSNSIVRPLIAENLASGRFWYDRFLALCLNKGRWLKITQYEKEGLQAMARDPIMTEQDEAAFIMAMHQAIFMGRGRIYAETMGQDAVKRNLPANEATKKRWERFMERLRLGLVGAKTANHVQSVINELLARNGVVKELRDAESVRFVRMIVFGENWQRARNLALFSLASYQRPPKVEPIPGDSEFNYADSTTEAI